MVTLKPDSQTTIDTKKRNQDLFVSTFYPVHTQSFIKTKHPRGPVYISKYGRPRYLTRTERIMLFFGLVTKEELINKYDKLYC